jgi:G2/mitotic-specific cyclin-B, other
MNIQMSENFENKENIVIANKSRSSLPHQRAFGTDLTKSISSSTNDYNDPQLLNYYASDIYLYLFSTEHQFIPKYGYMKVQADITEKMRAILIDWIVEVHNKFKLAPETLFLTVNLIDRYLEKIPVCRDRLQLVGVSAMLIASKYEDIYPPETRDFVYITDKAFTKGEVIQMETSILKQLDYNITVPSSYRFLERFSKVACLTDQQFALSKYLIELCLIDYRMLRFNNSMIAASAIYLTHKIKNIKPEWSEDLQANSPYKENEIKPCAKEICILFQKAPKSTLKGVKSKYSSAQYFNVANTSLI